MSARAWKAALCAAALVVGAGVVMLWTTSRSLAGTEITTAGSALSGAAGPFQGSGAVRDGVQLVAEPAREFSVQESLTTAVGPEDWGSLGAGSVVLRGATGQDGAGAATDGTSSAAADESSGNDSEGVMVVSRTAVVSGCAGSFNSPGEQITLAAAGFAGGATVSLTGHAASLGESTVSAPVLTDATADADGVIQVSWSVPSAPAASVDAAPRGYAVVASGANPAGGTHMARLLAPVVAYPGTPPCAVGDSASTALGAAVRVAVLANDVVPSGGSLDVGTVEVRAAAGGVFSVEGATGVVTFVPDAGFWGTVETTYAVYDGWGIGVEAELAVTVDAGCTITGTVGVTQIDGTEGADVICVPDRDDHRAFHVIDAKGGDDVVLGGAGVEWVYGGAGADVIYGNGGDDRIVAGAGVDTVYGGAGMDSVYSDDLADKIVDDDYETVLSAPAPAQSAPEPEADWVWTDVSQTVQVDVLENDHDPNEDLDPFTLQVTKAPDSGTATIARDSGGRPVVEFSAPSAGGFVSFSYEVCDSLGHCASAGVTVMVGTAECTIVGTSSRDRLRGTPGDDVICGLGGDDLIRGLGGDDVIVGGGGEDTIWGGAGADVLWGGRGTDDLYGEGGADRLWGGQGADSLQGGPGADRLFGGAGPDALTGGDGADRLWGGPSADVLIANSGEDTLWGGLGADTLYGGNDDDTIWGGFGDDTIRGGEGDDTIWAGPGDDTVDGLNGRDTIGGGPGDDTLRGDSGADMLWGGPGDDTLDGNNGADHLDGGPGTDTCRNADTQTECK